MINTQSKPILILGSSGQVGRALLNLLKEKAIGLDRTRANLEDPQSILSLFNQLQPSAVINAAAYTAVDLAEKNQELAMKINGEAPGILAQWCANHQIPFIHYSTDYVFSGTGESPWNEEDAVSPLSTYGRSKLEGERQIQSAGGSYLILRTSWVYDEAGKNFLNTMLRLGREKETLQIVSDQWGAPTYASHLASATLNALNTALSLSQFPTGIYHLCNSGVTNWHGFATLIFEIARKKRIPLRVQNIVAIPTSAFPTPAKRPLNSRLNLEKIERILKVKLPNWEAGLNVCMENLNESHFA